jgi:hypothetical protein
VVREEGKGDTRKTGTGWVRLNSANRSTPFEMISPRRDEQKKRGRGRERERLKGRSIKRLSTRRKEEGGKDKNMS